MSVVVVVVMVAVADGLRAVRVYPADGVVAGREARVPRRRPQEHQQEHQRHDAHHRQYRRQALPRARRHFDSLSYLLPFDSQ